MSFSDFLVIDQGSSNTIITGSSILNSSLSNPITSSIQCRVWNQTGQSNSFSRAAFFVSSSFSSGNLVNIPQTKSVSMRTWARLSAPNGHVACVGLLAKHSSNNNTGQSLGGNLNGSYPRSGYELVYQNSDNGRLMFSAGGVNANDGFNNELTITTNVGVGNWVGLRMDIIPVTVDKSFNGTITNSAYKDIIKIYTATVNDPDNWTLLDTKEYTIDNVRYVPWSSYTIQVNAQAAGQTVNSHYGFSILQNNDSRVYVEDFKILLADAF